MSPSFAAYSIMDATKPAIALVTGGRSGIGKAIANKIAEFPFIDSVLIVSRSVKPEDIQENPKLVAVAADIGTIEGRNLVVDEVKRYSGGHQKQLRFLIQSAGIIDPIKPIRDVQPEELQKAMSVNIEGPLFLSTALYPFMVPPNDDDDSVAGRILHVSTGAAHGAPPVGWGVYGISKAAMYQSFKVLSREFEHLGSKVVVGSFKPGVVDTSMQGVIREAPEEHMPVVGNFKSMKEKVEASNDNTSPKARPPPNSALDTPENVAFFAEWLLLGTSDEEFSNRSDVNEHDIRDSKLYPKWIPKENLPNDN